MVKPKKQKDGRYRASIYLGKDVYGKKKYKDIYGKTEKECNNKIIDYTYKLKHNLIEIYFLFLLFSLMRGIYYYRLLNLYEH